MLYQNDDKYIQERSISQGNLILMLHREHPTKSGWWRKVRDNELGDVYYILERSIHKGYSIEDKELEKTHKKDSLYVIKANTIRYQQNKGN